MAPAVSNTSQQPPLSIPLRVSRIYVAVLGLMHLGGLAILLAVHLPVMLRGVIGALILASWFRQWRHLPGTGHGVQSLQALATGEWQLSYVHGEQCVASLRAYTQFSSSLVLLHFKRDERRGPGVIVLFRDAMNASEFRCLKVSLRTRSFADANP